MAAELKQHFPNHSFAVINRGVGGEEVGDMLKRFDNGVLAEHPDLVLWQLGTNSVIRNHQLSDTSIQVGCYASVSRDGRKWLRASQGIFREDECCYC